MCNQCCYVLTPSVWIAHLLLASTLKAYHDIIPDNLVGGDSGIPEAGNKESRQDLAQHANGSEWAWIGVCCHLHWEALWRFFQVAPRVVPHNKRHTQTFVDSGTPPWHLTSSSHSWPPQVLDWGCAHCCAEPHTKLWGKRPFFCRKQASQTWALVIYV